MTILDYGTFMVAGIVGVFGYQKVTFGGIAIWGLLKLTGTI